MKEHIDRFYRSLRYLQIDPGLSAKEMVAHSEEVVARNEHLRAEVGDWWLGQRVSRGVDAVGDEGWDHTGPNVVIEMLPLPLAKRGKLYREGAEVMTTTAPPHRSVDAQPARQDAQLPQHDHGRKAHQGAQSRTPGRSCSTRTATWRGLGSNIFIVREGALFTPSERYVLPGVSRQMTMDMAKQIGVACTPGDIDMFDAANAEEMFLTSTSLCILPVKSFNGAPVGDGKAPARSPRS